MTLTDELQRASARGLALLDRLVADRVPPPQTGELVAALAADFPALRFELVWEREPYAGQVHYDLLIFTGDGESISLNVCPKQTLPWPLRSAVRASEGDLVRVGQRTVRIPDAMGYLDFLWQERRLVSRIVDTAIIDAELEARPIAVDDDALQAGMDDFRGQRGLLTAEATEAWLDRNCLTYERLEQLVELDCQIARLRRRITEEGRAVEARFAADPRPHRRVTVALLELPTAEAAASVAAAAEQQGFLSAAERELGRRAAAGRETEPLFRTFDRATAPPALHRLFDLEEGTLVPPTRHGAGFVVGKIVAQHAAVLDAATRERIEEQIFDEWLAARRAETEIEWYWGTAEERAG
jgi:putative peptide maturation system protein